MKELPTKSRGYRSPTRILTGFALLVSRFMCDWVLSSPISIANGSYSYARPFSCDPRRWPQ